MAFSRQLRIPILASVLGCTVVILGKILLFPIPNFPPIRPFQFPENVPLSEWEFKGSDSPTSSGDKHPQLLANRRYQYRKGSQSLDIEMQYIGYIDPSDLADFKIKHLIRDYTTIPPILIEQHQTDVGFYALLSDQEQVYLSACIPPMGNSTITDVQFQRNDTRHATRPDHIMAWLLGQIPYRDTRCLWTTLSMATDGAQPDIIYPTLESAWFSWYEWWRQHFPKA